MKIALLGYGNMGKMIETIALKQGIEVTEKYWDEKPLICDDAGKKALENVDILMDFTLPEAVLENVRTAAALKTNIVIGTTGWQDQMKQVGQIIHNEGIGCVYAANFSIGVNLFYKIADCAGKIMSAFDEYDPYLYESHHQFKKDAPSGTAICLKNILTESYQKPDIPVTSVRAGYIPGTHEIHFDSPVDQISLQHSARNREGLAMGALTAAKWLAETSPTWLGRRGRRCRGQCEAGTFPARSERETGR